MYQTTLNKAIEYSGVGLHSGISANLSIYPAYADSGINIKRSDIASSEYIRLTPFNVSSTQLATNIRYGSENISTIEHLMSALYGAGVDNAYVEVDAPEIPIFDGSAAPILDLINHVGIRQLSKKRKYLKFDKKTRIEEKGKWIEVIPSRYFKITFEIDYPSKHISCQKKSLTLKPETYSKEIVHARTFGFKKDVELLWAKGLARGGSLDNCVIVDDEDGIINPGGLRCDDEFVSHKILDFIGDISLIGYRLLGHFRIYRSGHHLNNIFARKLLKDSNYKVVEISGEGEASEMQECPSSIALQGLQLHPTTK